MEQRVVKCPNCHSEALYHYGKSHNGKRRFICQVCDRQFIPDTRKMEIKARPSCPVCGKNMHVYMKKDSIVRFRCADYPHCKNYLKEQKENLNCELLHT